MDVLFAETGVRGELLSSVERRRRWSERERAAVARASWEPGACVADVARRFEVTRQQVCDWRAAARRGEFAGVEASAGFVEVITAPADDAIAPPSAEVTGPPALDATVEILAKGGRSLRLPASVSAAELVRLIRAVRAHDRARCRTSEPA
jgi:transposase